MGFLELNSKCIYQLGPIQSKLALKANACVEMNDWLFPCIHCGPSVLCGTLEMETLIAPQLY